MTRMQKPTYDVVTPLDVDFCMRAERTQEAR